MRIVPFLLIAVALTAASASADGIGPAVVTDPVAQMRGSDGMFYVVTAEPGSTLVEQRDLETGHVRRVRVAGHYSLPLVVWNHPPVGLSSSGRLLVLAPTRASVPVRTTRFVLIDTVDGARPRTIDLPGWFDFDALAPDGRTLFVIEHPNPQNQQRYRVRAFDLASRRLLARPLRDPRSGESEMDGVAMDRIDAGRVIYTLYAGPSAPFVHVLDTVRRVARCVDLPHSWSGRELRLEPSAGNRVVVVRINEASRMRV